MATNGMTFVDTIIAAPGATSTSATYMIDLTHYLCRNRRICITSSFPITSTLAYTVQSVKSVGNGVFNCDILITGTVSYIPYVQGSCACDICPVTENIWASVSVPVNSEATPTLTAGSTISSPTNVKECCSITNACSIVGSVTVSQS